MPAYYDGLSLFGDCVSCEHRPAANAAAVSQFFGIQGVQSIDGGTRGRTFMINGLWTAPDLLTIRGFEATLLSYADGVPRELVDTFGYAWPNVVFRGEYQGPPRPGWNSDGYRWPFKCVFHGLT